MDVETWQFIEKRNSWKSRIYFVDCRDLQRVMAPVSELKHVCIDETLRPILSKEFLTVVL